VQRICGLAPGAHGAVSREEVRRYCEACPICQKLKPARERLERAAGTIRRRPFTEYAFDAIVLPDADLHGFRYILTVVDSFSGAVELFPLQRASAEEVSRCLVDVMCRWIRPHSVRCDNAKSFASFMMQRLLAAARVEPHFVAPYSHRSNGQAENANRRVEHVLRQMILDAKLGDPTRNNWSVLLPMVRGIINSKLVHRHGCTANELLYGAMNERSSIFEDEPWREDVAPSVVPPSSEAAAAAEATISEWRRQHEVLLARCEAEQDALLQRMSDLQGPEAADLASLAPGDTVLVSSDERPVHKLGARWLGPYLVVSEPVGQRVTLQHLSSKKVSEFALNMCKRCDMSLMSDVDDWLPLAAADHFEYLVEAVEQHRPAQRRLPNGRLRPKSDFEFLVRWEGLPIGDENPSWEPWSNASLRSTDAFSAYLSKPEVIAALGADFAGLKPKETDEAPGDDTRKKRR
jgi:transposase InsO family protein